jgi:hypothetical protein
MKYTKTYINRLIKTQYRIEFLFGWVLLTSMILYTYINLGEKDIALWFALSFMLLGGFISWVYALLFIELKKEYIQLTQIVLDEKGIFTRWGSKYGYATGHGDTCEDILDEFKAQIEQGQREKDAGIVESIVGEHIPERIAKAIRERQ